MGREASLSINLTIAEKATIAAQAKKLGLSASAYGYIKLFAPARSTIRTTDQKYAFGEAGWALNSCRRLSVMVNALAEQVGLEDPVVVELLQELAVLERHTLGAYNYLLGDLRASQTNQGL